MHITFVKKIKADGSPCRKCAEVEGRLADSGRRSRIDSVLIADERDPQSPGMRVAVKHHVTAAPFFVVRDDAGEERVFTVYFQFVKEVLDAFAPEEEKPPEAPTDEAGHRS